MGVVLPATLFTTGLFRNRFEWLLNILLKNSKLVNNTFKLGKMQQLWISEKITPIEPRGQKINRFLALNNQVLTPTDFPTS